MKRRIKTNKYHTIISVVGGQPSPVVIPFYQFDFERAMLIGTIATADECKKIKYLLYNKFNKPVEIIETDAYSFSRLKSELKSAMERFGFNKGQNIFANITGGTKPMSIQLLEWARDIGATIGYVSTETGKVILLKKEIEELEINAKISIKEYLELHGFDCSEDSKGDYIKDLQKNFYEAISNGEIIGNRFKFNIGNNEMMNKKLKYEFENLSMPSSSEVEVPLTTEKIFKFSKLAGGGYWFEEFLFRQLKKTGYFDDVRKQMIIKKNAIKNEIDIMVIKNFKLGLISCKVRAKKKNIIELRNKIKVKLKNRIEEFNKDLNELISLQSFLGKYTRMFLATTNDLSEYFRDKAMERGVIVYDINDLRNFEKMKKNIAELIERQIPST